MSTSDSGQDQSLRVWLFGAPVEDPVLDILIGQLQELGAAVHGPTLHSPQHEPDAVAVLLTPAAADEEGMRQQLEPWSDRLVPVSLGGTASPLFAELSQVIPTTTNTRASARRILAVAEAPGVDLAAYYHLGRAAATWQASGRPTESLLSGGDLRDAQAALAMPSVQRLGRSGEVMQQYVDQSGGHQRRRRLRASVIAGATCVLLVIAIMVAQMSQMRANTAKAVSIADTNRADSLRLARMALDSTTVNPDLPLLLASEAMRLQPTDEALATALRLRATQVPHRTFSLDVVPVSLSANSNGVVAVGDTTGGVKLMEPQDAATGARIPASETLPRATVLTPSAERIAVSDGERTLVREVATGEVLLDFRSSGFPMFWLDESRLAVSGSRDQIVDVRTGDTVPLEEPSGSISAWSVSADGRYVGLLASDRVVVLLRETLELVASERIAGGQDLAFTGDGKTLVLVTDADALAWTDFDSGGRIKSLGNRIYPPITPGPGPTVVTAASGDCTWWEVESNRLTSWWERESNVMTMVAQAPCHGGSDVAGIATLSDGSVVTTGGDRSVRLWSSPTAHHSPLLGEPARVDYFTRYSTKQRSLMVGHVVVDADGRIVTVPADGGAPFGASWRLEPKDLSPVEDPRLWQNHLMSSVLSPSGLAVSSTADGYTGVMTLDSGQSWGVKSGCFPYSGFPGAVSDNGMFAVCASPEGLVLASEDNAELLSGDVSVRSLVAVFVNDSGDVTSVTDDGEAVANVRGEVTAEVEPLRIAPVGHNLVGVHYDADRDEYVSLATDGTVFECRRGAIRTIASVGPDLRGYALSVGHEYVALVGASDFVVVQREHGVEVLRIPQDSGSIGRVHDVTFLDEAAYVLTDEHRVVKIDLEGATINEYLEAAAPRELTAEERATFRVPEE